MHNIAFTSAMLRRVIDEHRSLLAGDYVAIGELYIAQPERVLALWSHAPHTVVHGDAHLGNVFVDGARVGFLDWGLLAVAPAMRDVSYFLALAMTAKERRASEGALLEHYLGVRKSLGGAPIALDEAWRAHRLHAGYLVLASFLSLVPPYNAPDQREFSEAFRARATDAIEDLGAAGAMRAALARA
jgi:aminoglycoside phosphotransferase (APT) family kinase protein